MVFDWAHLIQILLEGLITLILPVLFAWIIKVINAHIQELNSRKDNQDLRTVVTLVRQFVLAAEQSGLAGHLENIGKAKKQYVLDLIQAELDKRGVKIDIDVLDALIEAQVKDALNNLDDLFPPESEPAAE